MLCCFAAALRKSRAGVFLIVILPQSTFHSNRSFTTVTSTLQPLLRTLFQQKSDKCVYEAPTIHLKNVGLKQFLISISMTGVVAHVGCGHLGDVQ